MPSLPSLLENSVTGSIAQLRPEIMKSLGGMQQEILRGDSPLSTAQREFIGAYVSGLNACHYCYGSHKAVAQNLGVDPTELEGALTDLESADVDAHLKPLLRFVQKLTLKPSKMTQNDTDIVLAAGWSERALVDAILVCATFSFMNRYVEGIGLVGTDEGFTRAGQFLIERGYQMSPP